MLNIYTWLKAIAYSIFETVLLTAEVSHSELFQLNATWLRQMLIANMQNVRITDSVESET